MQLLLPIFPRETKMINPILGVFENDDFVYYLLSGMPIHTHFKDNIESFRWITAKLVIQRLCKQADIARCFGVSEDSIYKSVKRLREKGEAGFFEHHYKGGRKPKLIGSLLERIQESLNQGESNYSIAKREGISEGTIRNALKTGTLKKNK
jgi:transposase